MSVTFLGTKSLGAANIALGLAAPAIAAFIADVLARIAALQGQVTANLALIATLPDPVAMAQAIAAAAAAALAAIADIITSIPLPLIDANVGLGLDLAALLALLPQIQLIFDTLTAAVSAGGVHAFKVDATPATVGGELSALVSGGINGGLANARIRGVLFVTENPATFAAMSTVLLTG